MMSLPRSLCVCLAALTGAAALAVGSPLSDAATPFVRAQADSAIHWQPWNETTLAAARASGRCVYVFIGSPLSELSRATVQQTFGSTKTIAWLNENFFCIFVDADAQPAVAAYGQHFIRSVKQLPGQPVHLWLVPDTLRPYDGANYLPPSEEWGKPGFLKAARAALDAWGIDPARARALADEAAEMMRPLPIDASVTAEATARLASATAAWTAAVDPAHGGFGASPKLPEPELIRFLLTRDEAARGAAQNAAHALVAGAARDPVDGGFYRRCIDEAWLEPYLQKLLGDQARIALALLAAGEAGTDTSLRAAALGALDFVLRDLRLADGSFAAALDGTLQEMPDRTQRPAFVPVGTASSADLGLLVVALQSSREPRFTAAAASLFARIKTVADTAMPADFLAVALAARTMRDDATAEHLLARANALYFDPISGAYQASPATLPPGITARVPMSGDIPSAEVLALLAGVDGKTAGLIRRNLLYLIEYDERPAGDTMLGLAPR